MDFKDFERSLKNVTIDMEFLKNNIEGDVDKLFIPKSQFCKYIKYLRLI